MRLLIKPHELEELDSSTSTSTHLVDPFLTVQGRSEQME